MKQKNVMKSLLIGSMLIVLSACGSPPKQQVVTEIKMKPIKIPASMVEVPVESNFPGRIQKHFGVLHSTRSE